MKMNLNFFLLICVICSISVFHTYDRASAEVINSLPFGQNGNPTIREYYEDRLDSANSVQFRGRNVADDWVKLVRDLQTTPETLAYAFVKPLAGGGLCQTYMKHLGLPGCSRSVQQLAEELNPNLDGIINLDDQIKIPILPLYKDNWTMMLDKELQVDADRILDLYENWKSLIKERVVDGSAVLLKLDAYKTYIPEVHHHFSISDTPIDKAIKERRKTEQTISPAFDRGTKTRDFQKNVIGGGELFIKRLFAVPPQEHIEQCVMPDFEYYGPSMYSSLLNVETLPSCATECKNGACPKIHLFDTKVFLHPDIEDAVVEGGVKSSNTRSGRQNECPVTDFVLEEHHGTMLSSIMVGKHSEPSHFAGLAPASKLLSYNVKERRFNQKQKDWAKLLNEISFDRVDAPHLVVFAGEIKVPSKYTFGNRFKNVQDRTSYSDVIKAILDNRLIWITAAGHHDDFPGVQITKGSALSPMNLGDQLSVIVVTSCEKCSGPNAKLWDNAFWSNSEDGLINLAAPGGLPSKPIPGPANDIHYSKAWGTSQATAFVGGLSSAMLTCFPNTYKYASRILKTRLQVTATPLPSENQSGRLTGGVVDVERALFDPRKNWLRTINGLSSVSNVAWCKEEISFEVGDETTETISIRTKNIGAILKVGDGVDGNPLWRIASADPQTAKVKWTGSGRWTTISPLFRGSSENQSGEESFSGHDIISYIPKYNFHKIGTVQCEL